MELRPIGLQDAGDIERDVATFAQPDTNGGLIVTGSPAATVHRDLITSAQPLAACGHSARNLETPAASV